jgi:hypothetical protein
MNSLPRKLKPILIISSIIALNACSDGSDDSGSDVDDAALAKIDHENAGEVAARSFVVAVGISQLGIPSEDQKSALGHGLGSIPNYRFGTGPGDSYDGFPPLGMGQYGAYEVPIDYSELNGTYDTDSGSSPSKPDSNPQDTADDSGSTDSKVKQCAKSGSKESSVQDSDGDNKNDTIIINFNDCIEKETLVTGDLTLQYSSNGEEGKIHQTSKSLTIKKQDSTAAFQNMSTTIQGEQGGLSFDLDMEQIINDEHVIVDTEPPFKSSSDSKGFDTGVMTIKGTNGSSVSLDADTGDFETVLVTINDGATTQSHTVPWSKVKDIGGSQ